MKPHTFFSICFTFALQQAAFSEPAKRFVSMPPIILDAASATIIVQSERLNSDKTYESDGRGQCCPTLRIKNGRTTVVFEQAGPANEERPDIAVDPTDAAAIKDLKAIFTKAQEWASVAHANKVGAFEKAIGTYKDPEAGVVTVKFIAYEDDTKCSIHFSSADGKLRWMGLGEDEFDKYLYVLDSIDRIAKELRSALDKANGAETDRQKRNEKLFK